MFPDLVEMMKCAIYIVSLIVIAGVPTSPVFATTGAKFSRVAICSTDILDGSSCFSDTSSMKNKNSSKLRCAATCSQNSNCSGFAHLPSSESCRLQSSSDCDAIAKCNDTEYHNNSSSAAKWEWNIYEKVPDYNPCKNGGVFDPDDNSCTCSGGWIGALCEIRASTCYDLYLNGYSSTRHIVDLDVFGNGSVIVRGLECNVQRIPQLLILRSNGLISHNKSWEDYKMGYEIDSRNFWIGLDTLSTLAAAGFDRIKFAVYLRNGNTLINPGYHYDGVTVRDESSDYTLSFAKSYVEFDKESLYAVNDTEIGDCLAESKGVPFSTPDHYTPGHDFAARAGAGWWFPPPDQVTCNPMGWSYKGLKSETTTDRHLLITGLDLLGHIKKEHYKYVLAFFKPKA